MVHDTQYTYRTARRSEGEGEKVHAFALDDTDAPTTSVAVRYLLLRYTPVVCKLSRQRVQRNDAQLGAYSPPSLATRPPQPMA